MKNYKFYSLMFPIWFFWLIPSMWIIILPLSLLFDFIIIVIAMKILKIEDKSLKIKKILIKVWIFGFIVDVLGAILLFSSNLVEFGCGTAMEWWNSNISFNVSFNPLQNIYSFIWVFVSVGIVLLISYVYMKKFCLNNIDLSKKNIGRLSILVSIFTAPYIFLIPTIWFM